MTAPNPLARMVRLYRIGESKSLRELAIEIGLAPATVHRIEQGRAMDLETWLAVQAWLLGREPQPVVQASDLGRGGPPTREPEADPDAGTWPSEN